MGGNASLFIADLYLSWCEYCYMTKVVKTDYALDCVITSMIACFGQNLAILNW